MFLLQQGSKMLAQTKEFLRTHPDSGVIMSARVCKRVQMERHLPIILNLSDSHVFFDPHFYEPRTDLRNILTYPYFEGLNFTTSDFDHREFCIRVAQYQRDELGLENVILPGRYTNSLTENWLRMHYECADQGVGIAEGVKVYSTIAIGPDVVLNPESLSSLTDEIINYPTPGIYFVFEHPRNRYFVDEEFMYVLLDALLSISLSGKDIIVGYANQQFLALFAAGVEEIASGNYRNVRAFDHLDSSIRVTDSWRKATWYFDGFSFGEYRIPALSLAFRRNIQNLFGPSTPFAEPLLTSRQPTAIPWSETQAFAHYLALMYLSTDDICSVAKRDRAEALIRFFQEKLQASVRLQNAGFTLGDRGFYDAASATLSALESFRADRADAIQALQ